MMNYRNKFLTGLGLILLLLVGKISIFDVDKVEESRVEELEIKPLTFENDICSLYDIFKVIDSMLFERKYKPLIVIIAANLSIGVNRVRNLSGNKRILNDDEIKNNPHHSQLYQTILENIYLFQANDKYYFVYPLNFQHHFLTIYSQRKLLNNNLGITFDFVNLKKKFPFFDDIFIPLEPSCTNCPVVKYVKEKLQKGESFSELFQLRKKLFREKQTKNLSFTPFDNDYICTSMGFNINSQSSSSLMRFNSLLEQIQNNSKNVEKRRTVERSRMCFQSRQLKIAEDVFYGNMKNQLYLNDIMVTIDYLNWINNTISSLNGSDISFGGLCENEHKIGIFKLFCFMKGISDVTSHNITEWTVAIKKLLTKSLISKLRWFNRLIYLYKNEYTISKNYTSMLEYLKEKMLTVSENWSNVMNITYNIVKDSLRVNNHFDYNLENISICTIYENWETIDDLLFEANYKRLVIIVVDDIKKGIKIAKQIRARRVVPNVRQKDLHYSEKFLYDFIMKHIYLVESNDTYYYVYPTTTDRQENPLIIYLEYKMITDYSNVIFYYVNAGKYFPFDERLNLDDSDLVIPALPDYCRIPSGRCKKRYINPSYLIKVNQEFLKRFPKYLPLYASFYNNLTEFTNNYDSHHKDNYYSSYHQTYYDFAKEQQFTYDIIYKFIDLPCLSMQKLNNRTDINFSMTKFSDVLYFYKLITSAYGNITSLNDRNNTNLELLCSNKEIFKFIKFFCFLKINYIEGMLKVIDQKSYKISYMKSIVQNEKNTVTEYLLKTKDWIEELLSMQHLDYMYNEIQLFIKSDALYSEIPKIISNGTDLSDKIYSIVKSRSISILCKTSLIRN
ncbi:uncharacterized protein LOC122501312 [Leptopilina heterotoma]|uniref:uncharacterized protein LOC122501312 n=1 Tax=Leptopilina heterotoma TaxID=63436 RepID=UPI001CA8AF97|nr:uncharacterized protein LOC122501312 [Leptopilina heterotoma]